MIAEPLQVFTPVFVLSKTVTQLTHRDRLSPNSQNADYVLSVRNLIYSYIHAEDTNIRTSKEAMLSKY